LFLFWPQRIVNGGADRMFRLKYTWPMSWRLSCRGLTGFLMVARIGCFGCNTPNRWQGVYFVFGLTGLLMVARIGCFGYNTTGRCRGVELVVASADFWCCRGSDVSVEIHWADAMALMLFLASPEFWWWLGSDVSVAIHWAFAVALILIALTGFLMMVRIGCFGCNTSGRCNGADLLVSSPNF